MHQLNTPATPPLPEYEVDLKRLLATVIRHSWQILAIVAVAMAVTWAFNYALLTPVYESSGVVSIPPADFSSAVQLTNQGYIQLADSPALLDSLGLSLGAKIPAGADLRGRYRISFDSDNRFLTVVATASDPQEALLLARAWISSFQNHAEAEVIRRFTKQKDAATEREAGLQPKLAQAEANFARSERQGNLGVMKARLAAFEQEIVSSEVRLRQVNTSTIPLDEARLAFLNKTLETTQSTILPTPSASGAAGNTSPVANPAHVQISQEVVATSVRLAVAHKEAEVLGGAIPALEKEAQQLRTAIGAAQEEQALLSLEAKKLGAAHAAASGELERLLQLEGQIPQRARPATVQEPSLPAVPISPRRERNLVLAGALSTFLAVGVVLLREWYRAPPMAPGLLVRPSPSGASREELVRPPGYPAP